MVRNFPSDYYKVDDLFVPIDRSNPSCAFGYSDGDEFEERISTLIANASDRSLFSKELRSAIWDWRSACHLSPVRANILRPLESICRGRVLELGSGCGIITRYLGELGAQLVALEASPRRALITRQRTADLSNVDVVCERIEHFNANEKFDLVTMIGVLQYARLFTISDEKPELQLLRGAIRQLCDNGVLVIAIQNKLSLKSLAGYPEANVGVPYFGIEGRYQDNTIVRFGLDEIKALLGECGLPFQAILTPAPDYHMPVSILNESAMQPNAAFRAAPLLAASVGRDRIREDWTRPMFSLERAWDAVLTAGAAGYLANAFLIIAGRTPDALAFHREKHELAWHYSVERHPAFATGKRFLAAADGIEVLVDKICAAPEPAGPLTHHVANEKYVEGRLWWECLVEIVNRPGWTVSDIAKWVRPWLALLNSYHATRNVKGDDFLPGTLFDCTPLNCVQKKDGTLIFIDQEWELHTPLKLSYLVIRGMFGSLVTLSSCAQPALGVPVRVLELISAVLREVGLEVNESDFVFYSEQERIIQAFVVDGEAAIIMREPAHKLDEIALDCRVSTPNLVSSIASIQSDMRSLEVDYQRLLLEFRNVQAAKHQLQEECERLSRAQDSNSRDFLCLQNDYRTLLNEHNQSQVGAGALLSDFHLLQTDYKRLLEEYNRIKEAGLHRE